MISWYYVDNVLMRILAFCYILLVPRIVDLYSVTQQHIHTYIEFQIIYFYKHSSWLVQLILTHIFHKMPIFVINSTTRLSTYPVVIWGKWGSPRGPGGGAGPLVQIGVVSLVHHLRATHSKHMALDAPAITHRQLLSHYWRSAPPPTVAGQSAGALKRLITALAPPTTPPPRWPLVQLLRSHSSFTKWPLSMNYVWTEQKVSSLLLGLTCYWGTPLTPPSPEDCSLPGALGLLSPSVTKYFRFYLFPP